MNDNVTYLTIAGHLPPIEDRDWVTSTELAALADITYRQLDYWTRTGLLDTITQALPGSGYTRAFDRTQVTKATALRDLLAAGVSLITCRAVIDELLDTGSVDVGAITFVHHPQGGAA